MQDIMTLQRAVLCGSVEKLGQLIRNGAQIDERNDRGETALISAAQTGSLNAVKILIKFGADVDCQDQNGRSPLFYAYQKGHTAVVDALLNASASCSITDANSDESPTFTICRWGHSFPLFLRLIEEGADLNAQHKDGWTPLHVACRNDRLPMVRKLVKAGADVDMRDKLGCTALMLASLGGHSKVVEALIHANVDVNLRRRSGATSLHMASHNGHVEVVNLLIEAGADIDIKDENGRSPLHTACSRSHVDVMKALIKANARVNEQDVNGWTPLFTVTVCSRQSVREKAVRLLLENGATIEIKPRYPSSNCLEFACFSGCFDLVRAMIIFLAEKNFDVASLLPASCKIAAIRCTQGLLSRVGDDHSTLKAFAVEWRLSKQLHEQLNRAGFTSRRAALQSAASDALQRIERHRRGWRDIFLVGSFAEAWGNSLLNSRGKTDPDSDIDAVELVPGRIYHLRNFCRCKNVNPQVVFEYENGHVSVQISANTPARHDYGSTLRPAFDKVDAYECCCYPYMEVVHSTGRETHLPESLLNSLKRKSSMRGCHLVAAAPPGKAGLRLRVSTSFLEKLFMRSLNDLQGQLFIILKWIIKRVIPEKAQGLKTYHAKCLVLYMVDETPAVEWQPKNLVKLAKLALQRLLNSLLNKEITDAHECMKHFFLRDAAVYLRCGHTGKENIAKAIEETIVNLPFYLTRFLNSLKPLQSQIEPHYFHPFLDIPYMFLNYLSSLQPLAYHEIYGSVRYVLLQMAHTKVCTHQSLLKVINRLPDCTKTARETLRAMAFLKFGQRDRAISTLRQIMNHQVSRGIPYDPNRDYQSDGKEIVWQYLNSTDTAWKFEIDSSEHPKFYFLPRFIRDKFLLKIDQYEQFFFVNFDAMKKCLLLEFTRDCSGDLAQSWFSIVKDNDDADAQELLMTLHYCSNSSLLVEVIHKHRSVMVNELSVQQELLQLVTNRTLLRRSCLSTLSLICDYDTSR